MLRCRRVVASLVWAVVAAVLVSGPSRQAFSHQSHAPARDAARPQAMPDRVHPNRGETTAAFGRVPLHFEAHEAEGTFLTRGGGYTLVLRPSEAWLSLEASAADLPQPELAAPTARVVRMQLLGAATVPKAAGLDPMPGKVHYLLGNDPAKWRTGIPTFGKVQYRDVYPGIDLVYYGNQNKLEFDFIVAPNKATETIKLLFPGVDEARIDAKGDLVLGAGADEVRLLAPTLYQEFEAKRQPVTGRYVLDRQTGSNAEPVQVGFAVGTYDTTRPLVIDPVLEYSSYLGWAGAESVYPVSRTRTLRGSKLRDTFRGP